MFICGAVVVPETVADAVYEKAVPIVPDAVSGLVITGTEHSFAGITVTVAVALEEPPGPVQVIEYVVVTRGPTSSEPEVAVLEVHGAVHETELLEIQESVEVCPWLMLAGTASRTTDGAGVHSPEETADALLEKADAPSVFTAFTR
jgi:hypothetical protein